MKKLFLLAFFALFSTSAFAVQGTVENVFSATALSGTDSSVKSRIFPVGSASRMGYWFKAAKASTPEGAAVRMTIEASYDETAANFATYSTVFPVHTFATTSTPIASTGTITTPDMKFIRFVAVGNTGNATGTTITMYMFKQERA